MFERYTEKARRTIFFGRYEASEFGSLYIETEHLLLGLLREDKALANRFLGSHAVVDSIREQIAKHSVPGGKTSVSVDLPLSVGCKRALAFGAEEAEQLNHKHIGTEHLLLGLLREECFAAQLLREQGATLESVRKQLQESQPALAQSPRASFARFDVWLADCEARGGFRIVAGKRGPNETSQAAIYTVENGHDETAAGAAKIMQIRHRINFIVGRMENAIANHEFEKARFYSDEERKERENLRLLGEQFNVEDSPPEVPLLCIEIVGDERFTEVQRRCDDYIAEGVTQIWLLDPGLKRAYTVTKAEGLREFKGGILQIADPPLEMDLRTVFG